MNLGSAFSGSDLGTVAAAAGALGAACFGIVEGLKWTPIGEAGFGRIVKYLGPDLLGSLKIAYGPEYERLLRAQYRQDSQTQAGIAKTLRQGVRIGLTAGNASAIANFLGTVDAAALQAAVTAVANAAPGETLSSDTRGVIGRYEMAVDARIESALSRAKDVYLGSIRFLASFLAIGIAELVVFMLSDVPAAGGAPNVKYIGGFIVGLIAVPIAPIVNDVVGALQAATKALRS
jgi:hypothetical protein